MSAKDKFKAAFLSNSNLGKKLRDRVDEAMGDLDETRSLVETLPETKRAAVHQLIDDLEQRVQGQAAAGATAPGPAWVAMDALQKEAKKRRADLLGIAQKEAKGTDPTKRFEASLRATMDGVGSARSGTRAISNEAEAKSLQAEIVHLGKRVQTLVSLVAGAGGGKATAEQCTAMDAMRVESGELVRAVRAAQGLAPQPGTQRANSKATVQELSGIKAIGDRLASTVKDPQGRTAMQDVQGRLEVFDQHFAADVDADPRAAPRNKAMRLAAVASVTADRIARDVNDPYLTPRIGQSMVAEYAPEMKDALEKGDDDDSGAKDAIVLAQALVMDDPIGLLMTGKLNPADAVQRIRDMAAVGGEKPSVMLKLLRQQYEMKIGSLSHDEVRKGTKAQDKNTNGNFILENLVGEMSGDTFDDLVHAEMEPSDVKDGQSFARPKWDDKAEQIQFKASGAQEHVVKAGETLAGLAFEYCSKDATKWTKLQDDNKMVVVKGKQHDLKALAQNDPLPVGAVLMVPAQSSALDQLAPYVAAWDDADEDDDDDYEQQAVEGAPWKKSGQPYNDLQKKAPGATTAKEAKAAVTPDALKQGAAKLKSPRDSDPEYTQVPGLGQNHKVRAPLGSEADIKSKSKRKKTEEEKLQGQINQRQYAHLRMLERADAEDREAAMRREGKPLDAAIAEKIAKRYGTNRVDDAMARKIAKAAMGWIANVPLTLTFTADRLFSDPAKNSPTHGADYKSDVELTRGRENLKDLIGRGKNVKGVVGTQGGSKTVTGWKDRGDNYMRWRRDKDDREGRHTELAYEDQQIFSAANPAFAKAKGGADGTYGSNYYGTAHFLLRDSIRNRCAYIVRASGGKTPPVQRKDMEMLLYDMLLNADSNSKFLDSMLSMAAGGNKVTVPSLNWEVHFYGGFDMKKDAAEMYLADDLDPEVRKRIAKFAKANGMTVQSIGSKPDALQVMARQDPQTMELPAL